MMNALQFLRGVIATIDAVNAARISMFSRMGKIDCEGNTALQSKSRSVVRGA